MIRGEPVKGRDYRLHRDLLIAIERTRSQLAVAIAAENKNTPRERWRHYLATEDRTRRCVREFRRHRRQDQGKRYDWSQALHLLKQPLPATDSEPSGRAILLCQRLHDVLEIIEGADCRQ